MTFALPSVGYSSISDIEKAHYLKISYDYHQTKELRRAIRHSRELAPQFELNQVYDQDTLFHPLLIHGFLNCFNLQNALLNLQESTCKRKDSCSLASFHGHGAVVTLNTCEVVS